MRPGNADGGEASWRRAAHPHRAGWPGTTSRSVPAPLQVQCLASPQVRPGARVQPPRPGALDIRLPAEWSWATDSSPRISGSPLRQTGVRLLRWPSGELKSPRRRRPGGPRYPNCPSKPRSVGGTGLASARRIHRGPGQYPPGLHLSLREHGPRKPAASIQPQLEVPSHGSVRAPRRG
jgi:hypothetical protein